MKKSKGSIPKGQMVVITFGEYSDRTTMAVCKFKEDVDLGELEKEYFKLSKKSRNEYNERYSIISWILDKYAYEYNFSELNLGSDSYNIDFKIF